MPTPVQQGIQIIGDIPIYVAFDSADTWASPELFQFDEENNPVGSSRMSAGRFFSNRTAVGQPICTTGTITKRPATTGGSERIASLPQTV